MRLASLLLLLSFTTAASAQTTWTDSTLYTFTIDHELEPGPLMQASDGNFYGLLPCITSQCNGYIYQLTPAGVYTPLYSFTGGNDGEHPVGRLIEGPDGNLYGTTDLGGANSNGTVFRIPLGVSGALTTVYAIPAYQMGALTNCYSLPAHGLTLGSDGNFYITSGGGGGGCMWSVTPGGVATLDVNTAPTEDNTITFNDVPTQGSDGNWYMPASSGLVVWTPGSTTFTVVGITIGSSGFGLPANSELVEGPDGLFYFTDTGGGGGATDNDLAAKTTTGGGGTILQQIGASGPELTGMFLASNGDFYGSFATGGANSDGEIYQLTSSGTFTDILDFNGTDGAGPYSMPFQAADGNLYGVTEFSGSESQPAPGLVWKLSASPTLAAPVLMSFSTPSPAPGEKVTLNWSVSNAFSTTMQQCYAYGTWSGKQTGTYSSSTHLYSGSASVTIPTSGSYNYALTCGGRESQILASSLLTSSTALSVSPNPQTVGGRVTIDVTVSGSGPTLGGQVELKTGSTVITSLALSAGKASITVPTTAYPAGVYPLQAVYSGDSTYQGSVSPTVNVTLSKAGSTTTVTATPNPVTPPGNVSLKVTVASGGTGITATGTVTFYTGTTEIGSAKLSGGRASLTAPTTGIAAGSYPVVAKYPGNADNKASQGTVTVVVK